MRQRTTVLIAATGWWPAPARIAAEFSRCGLRVVAVCPRGHPLHYLRKLEKIFRYPPLDWRGGLARVIAECNPKLIVPCDDRVTAHLHALYADRRTAGGALSEVLWRSLGNPASYPLTLSRGDLLRIATDEGIRVPETMRITSERELELWRAPLPWVLKTNGSWGGMGVRVVHSRAEARQVLPKMLRPLGGLRAWKRLIVNRDAYWLAAWLERRVPEVIVQAFVPGDPATTSAVCWGGEMLSSLSACSIGTQGGTGPATFARVLEHDEMSAAARRLAVRLGLSGLHGFDFMLAADGSAWLIEMNPRATQLCHVSVDGGPSLAAALAARLCGKPVPAVAPAAPGSVIAFFPQAWRSDPGSSLLRLSGHDVPWDEPDLLEELIRPPWPNRGRLARIWERMRGQQTGSAAWAGAAAKPYKIRRNQSTGKFHA